MTTLEPSLKAVDLRNPASGAPGWWAVRCPHCRTWLTKYDHSPQEALDGARYVLASGGHRCT